MKYYLLCTLTRCAGTLLAGAEWLYDKVWYARNREMLRTCNSRRPWR
jgi:hypothetical protein